MAERRKQLGVAFPAAGDQTHLLIIRLDISDFLSDNKEEEKKIVRTGLKSLCKLIASTYSTEKKIDSLSEDGRIESRSLMDFNFSFTIGFGIGFFDRLRIDERNRPRKLTSMPDSSRLGDESPYTLQQTDFIIQLGSKDDYVNRWIFQNTTGIKDDKEETTNAYSKKLRRDSENTEAPPDIYTAIKSWAKITDIHAGFQRLDGKNLLGLNHGISNPFRLSNDVIWTTKTDEIEKFQDGTYMVFQKIEHDLEKWQNLREEKQEMWIGRSKYTGLLLGTLPKQKDRIIALNMHSNKKNVREEALREWKTFRNLGAIQHLMVNLSSIEAY